MKLFTPSCKTDRAFRTSLNGSKMDPGSGSTVNEVGGGNNRRYRMEGCSLMQAGFCVKLQLIDKLTRERNSIEQFHC